jgi:hypothetical protein
MTTYSEIIDAEVEFKKAASFTTARKFRDNVLAIAEGDATVPNAKRVNPPGFRRPTAATQSAVIAHQGPMQRIGDLNWTVIFFQAVVIIPGVYTFAGTRTSPSSLNTAKVFVNGVEVYAAPNASASFSHEMTLVIGDAIRVDVRNNGELIDLTNFRLMSEYHTPMGQCHFNRFVGEETP